MPTVSNTSFLDARERCALIERVFAKAYNETESWRSEDQLGADLAYLAWAIATASPACPQGHVLWEMDAPILALFRDWFSTDDPVWQFIETEA